MPYGTIKIDTITFTDGGVDKSVPVSGLVLNPTFTGNVTVTGTISGNIIQGGTTVSGLTVTGTTANFASGVFTTQVSGLLITGPTVSATTGTFTSLTGTTTNGTTASFTTGNFTSLTGTTTTGTTANFASGVFTTQVSGLLITGPTVSATTGTFTSLTGTTTTGTTANFASGVFTTQISGVTITGTTVSTTTGNFTSLTGTTATFTSGIIASGTAALPSLAILSDPNTGIYSPGADQLAVATNGTEKLIVLSNGNVGIGTSGPGYKLDVNGEVAFSPNTAGKNTFFFTTNASNDANLILKSNTTDKVNIQANGTSYFNGGNVGIGTTGPSKLLTIGSSTTANTTVRVNNSFTAGSDTGMYSFGLDDSADFAGMKLNYSDRVAKGLQIFTTSGYGYPISFSTNGSQNMTIDTSGRLLVGMSSDLTGALLQVNGAMNSNKYQQNVTAGSTDTIFTMAASQCYHIYCTEGTNQTHSVAIASCAEGSSTAVLTSLYQSSANTVLSSSGLNIQVYNGAGSTRTMKTTILRMA